MLLATSQTIESPPAGGRYSLREARSATQDTWDEWLAMSPGGGHIFQSYVWGELKRDLGWRPIRLLMERDGKVAGAGQFLVRGTPFVTGNLMYCTKGPWIPWEDDDAVRTFFGGVRTVAEREGVHTVKIEPEVRESDADAKRLLSTIGFRKFRWDLNNKTTMVVDLSVPEEEVLARMPGKTRTKIRASAKKGVEILEDSSLTARDEFWTLMKVTEERNGFRMHRSGEYYQSVWRALLDSGQFNLFLAKHEGETLAGMCVYTFGEKYYYMYGASANDKRNLRPTYLLQWEVMRWAKARGYTYYDMVAIPNPNNLNENDPLWGVYNFKRSFGGEIAEFVGCLDWYVKSARARAWNRFEPLYYRAYQRLRGDIYY